MSGPLLLASASPRRTDLLTAAGVDHVVTPVSVDESWSEGEAPVPFARRLATAKATAAAGRKGDSLVLAADTVVWIDPHQPPLGKPRSREDAATMLQSLTDSEKPHFVTTAYCLIDRRTDPHTVTADSETTRVFMRQLTAAEREEYLDSGEWKDKAGGYGIQGLAAAFVLRIEGSYTNVVGLPVAQIVQRIHEIEGLPAAGSEPATDTSS